MRKIASLCLALNLYPLTKLNPADEPSRRYEPSAETHHYKRRKPEKRSEGRWESCQNYVCQLPLFVMKRVC